MKKVPEVLHIHALAKLAFEASAKGQHPIPSDESFSFLTGILRDRSLRSETDLDLFDRCFSLEIDLAKNQNKRTLPWQ